MKRFLVVATAFLPLLSACNSSNTQAYTLYRNSPMLLGPTARLHVATFDAKGETEYNRDNCKVAMQLFNADVAARPDKNHEGIGFWCEPGEYSQQGTVPTQFDAAFPTKSDSSTSW